MKKLIPLLLAVWVGAIVGCTTPTQTTTTTTTTQRQTNASVDPTVNMNRPESIPPRGPR